MVQVVLLTVFEVLVTQLITVACGATSRWMRGGAGANGLMQTTRFQKLSNP